METQTQVRPQEVRLRANSKYLRLMASVGFGALAGGMTGIALDLVAVLTLDATALQIAILNAFGTASYLLFGIPLGVLIDKWPKHRAMVAADLATAAALAWIPVSFALGTLAFPQLVVVGFVVGLGGMVYSLASQSALASIVHPGQLSVAYSRRSTVTTTMEIVAPMLAGQVLRIIAAPLALLVTAALRVVSAVFSATTPVPVSDSESGGQGHFWRSLREGLRFSWDNKPLLYVVLITMLVNGGLALGSAVELLYQVHTLNLDVRQIAFVLSSSAVGGVVGSFVAPVIVKRTSEVFCFALAVAGLVPVVVLVPLASRLGHGAFYVLVAEAVLYSALMLVFNVNAYTLVSLITPKAMLARQLSVMNTFSMGVVPVASILGGIAGNRLGFEGALWIWVLTAAVAAGVLAVAARPLSHALRTSKERLS